MSICYQIRAGVITSTEIPADGLPVLLVDANAGQRINLVALPGEEDGDFAVYTLPCVADIVAQVAPWATVFCSPDASEADNISRGTAGMAFSLANTAWIRSTEHPNGAIITAFHEAYHLAERWLTGDEIIALRQASERGPVLPRHTEYNAYWCDGSEVRARAFAAWSYSHWLMSTTPALRRGMPAHERLWTMIYTGAWACAQPAAATYTPAGCRRH